jgi:RNA ligase (TIGR02306 family)
MARKLASVQVIEEIRPIENADAIEAVRVLGWWVVVRKELNYQVGDLVIYFEIDSVLPNSPTFEEMLRGKPWSPRAARLKSVQFRGQISQGYVRHLADVLPGETYECGDDVTERVGVEKYEPPVPSDAATIAGHWLPGVPKTDEVRIQSSPGLLAAMKDRPYVITLKCDGSSATYGLDPDGVFWACSRNFRLKYNKDNSFWRMADKYPGIRDLAEESYYVQGELCGPGIQGNKLGLPDVDLFVFDIYDAKSRTRLPYHEMLDLCSANHLRMAPVLDCDFTYGFQYTTVDQLLDLAEGLYQGTNNQREGIVVRSLDRAISFKAISNKFLLKGGD